MNKFLLAIIGAIASIVVVVAPSYAAPPTWGAHATFRAPNPFAAGVILNLDVDVTPTTVTLDYWATGFDHLTGSAAVTPSQVSFNSFDSVTLENVVVSVSSLPGGFGYVNTFTLNFTWTGTEKPTVTPHVGKQAPATVSGSAIDLTGTTLFAGSQVTSASIERVHT